MEDLDLETNWTKMYKGLYARGAALPLCRDLLSAGHKHVRTLSRCCTHGQEPDFA